MASENKKRKLKNSNCVPSILKNKMDRLKRILFYTASTRKTIKNIEDDNSQ